MRPRTPSRALADWSLQGLMSRDEYDRYATRVAELKRAGLTNAAARSQAEQEVMAK